jgi:hypothetical protein
LSYDMPEFSTEVGNPANAAFITGPAPYINSVNPAPLSGR